jgi:hypothetical protein
MYSSAAVADTLNILIHPLVRLLITTALPWQGRHHPRCSSASAARHEDCFRRSERADQEDLR